MSALEEVLASPEAFNRACDASLDVALQPIFELQTGALHGVEALTRGWGALGFDSAPALFDAAEALGALETLETRQIERAIVKSERLPLPGAPNLFVNIDTRLLLSSTRVIDNIEAALRRVGRPKRLLTVELSERHEKTLEASVAERIRDVRRRGFQLALDDFGVGVSDIRSLHAFEIDTMKIDRFFVDGLADDRRKRFLVGRLVELAHVMGQKVVMEGVEREEDLAACLALGGDLVQGYLLGAPELDPTKIPTVTPVSAAATRRRATRSREMVENALLKIEPQHYAAPFWEIAQRFRDPEHPPYCPIVGDRGEPLGVICERDLRRFLFSPVGLDLIRNPTQPIAVEDMLQRYPLADVTVEIDRIAQILAPTGCDGVVITEGTRYLGFLPASTLVRLGSVERLAAAQGRNRRRSRRRAATFPAAELQRGRGRGGP